MFLWLLWKWLQCLELMVIFVWGNEPQEGTHQEAATLFLLMQHNEIKPPVNKNREGIFSRDVSQPLHSALTNIIHWQNVNSGKCHSALITFKCKSKGIRLRQVIFNNTSSWAITIFICHHLIDLCPFQFAYFMLITFLGWWGQQPLFLPTVDVHSHQHLPPRWSGSGPFKNSLFAACSLFVDTSLVVMLINPAGLHNSVQNVLEEHHPSLMASLGTSIVLLFRMYHLTHIHNCYLFLGIYTFFCVKVCLPSSTSVVFS